MVQMDVLNSKMIRKHLFYWLTTEAFPPTYVHKKHAVHTKIVDQEINLDCLPSNHSRGLQQKTCNLDKTKHFLKIKKKKSKYSL